MISESIAVFHAFNAFLSTVAGELLKRSVEGLFLVFITYMAVSEWTRSKKESLKFLAWAFGVLAFQKIILTFFLAQVVFGSLSLMHVEDLVAVVNEFMEILAIILLGEAFLFPLFVEKRISWLRRVRKKVVLCILGFICAEAWWVWRGLKGLPAYFQHSIPYGLLLVFKLVLLAFPIYFILRHERLFGKYARDVVLAFAVYSVRPLVELGNYILFDSRNTDWVVFAHPFLLLSVILFARVMFLKLADKALLKERLSVEIERHAETKELSKLKDEFVSIVSHELRTPLTSMKLYLSLLLSGRFGKLKAEQIKPLKTVQQESDRLSHLVQDTLTLSKLEQRKDRLMLERLELREVLDMEPYKRLAVEKGLRWVDQIPKPFRVKVDPEKFKQVFINLVGNAIKFTDQGSVAVAAGKTKKGWFFSVLDTGPGIAQDKLPKLFDKFYQTDHHMTREKGGTGLGLSIAKHIVELHKGKLRVESGVGHGTTFTVEMPN
ncbi:MAG TPA: HAMP domain-containing sensor histidine kinase [Candidatus Nanoarchaeia archaeon]|nr:HAMP domain-containing sensor histidine kinase [Candidatus Nanoarchaeia archaeon]